jgi:choline dehydrogenase
MLYVRGDPRTYDMWANEMGCPEWSYDKVLPYFKKSENLVDSSHNPSDTSIHGIGGPLTVTAMASPETASPVKDLLESIVSAGRDPQIFGPNKDYNGPEQQGISLAQITVKDGIRHDAANAFLVHDGAEKRPNLTIIADTMVTKVVMQGGVAVGVMIKQKNVPLCDERKTPQAMQRMRSTPTVFVGAKKEVIVSAGAVCTPWLLMLSGIGPQEHLNQVGVPLVKDLPVGENMQDHLFWGTSYVGKPGTGFNAAPKLSALPGMIKGAFDWMVRGTGIFYYPMCQALAFFRSGLQDPKWGNDCELHIVPFSNGDGDAIEKNSGVHTPESTPDHGITILPSL